MGGSRQGIRQGLEVGDGQVKVYIATSHLHAVRADALAGEIDATVVSTWTKDTVGYHNEVKKAIRDIAQIDDCDVFVCLAFPGSGGGMHNEVGYAMGRGKPVLLFGGSLGMLAYHPYVQRFASWSLLVDAINRRAFVWTGHFDHCRALIHDGVCRCLTR